MTGRIDSPLFAAAHTMPERERAVAAMDNADDAPWAMDGPHWAFSLEVYSRPDVPPACLALQDRLGLDVNVLLLALFFAGRAGAALTPETIAAADAEISPWREGVVVALRRVRVLLKDGPTGVARPVALDFREGIKARELLAEQIEQAALAGWFACRVEAGAGAASAGDLRETALRVARHYAARRPGGAVSVDGELDGLATRIAAAAHACLAGAAR